MTLLGLTGALNAVTSIVCGVVVWGYSRDRALAQSFAIYNLTLAGWSACYVIWQGTSNEDAALFWLRLLTVFALWINQAALCFVAIFTGRIAELRRTLWVLAFVNAAWTVLHFSPLLYAEVVPRFELGYWPIPRPLFHVFFVFYEAELLFAFYLVLSSLKRMAPSERQRAWYIVAGFVFAYVGGHSNWPVWYGVNSFPYLNGLVSVYVVITAYAIARHRVLETQIIVKRTLVYSGLTLILSALYVAILALVVKMFEGQWKIASPFGSAVAAGVVAALFSPVRTRLQRWVDRHFRRESLDQDMLREATGTFVHEIKRPLANISMPAQLALGAVEEMMRGARSPEIALPKVRDHLSYIVRQSIEAGAKMEVLRELATDTPSTMSTVSISDLVDRVIEAERARATELQISIRSEVSAVSSYVQGNAQQLEVVMANLVRNAIDALSAESDDSSRLIHVGTRLQPGWIEISVTDNGSGIASEYRPHLFEPYFTTKGARGTGIGLFISKEIVRRHGGSLTLKDTGEKGATFVVRLPARSVGDSVGRDL
jgi:signal transduction histidine kinase